MATMTPKECAIELATDAKTLRKFLRSDASPIKDQAPGKGSRWAIERKSLRSLKTKFAAWDAARKVTDDAESEDEATPAES